MSRKWLVTLVLVAFGIFTLSVGPGLASPAPVVDDSVKTIDHYVTHYSTMPAIQGQAVALYVREKVRSDLASSAPGAAKVVLFVHGNTYPSATAFDAPFAKYSWMNYLAQNGFDVFGMDIESYGWSTRPWPMNDPANANPSTATYKFRLNTSQSDWDDVGAVVNWLKTYRGVDKVSLAGWSMGGWRTGGYAYQHPENVDKLVELAPQYPLSNTDIPPLVLPTPGYPMSTQNETQFNASLNGQVAVPEQYDPEIRPVLWQDLLAGDPVGATWGPGVIRVRQQTTWGWTKAWANAVTAPTLLMSGTFDKTVSPQAVRNLYTDLGSQQKVFVPIPDSSHFAMWETNYRLILQASLEWLQKGTFNGETQKMFDTDPKK